MFELKIQNIVLATANMTLATAVKFETRKPRDINSLETSMESTDYGISNAISPNPYRISLRVWTTNIT